MDWKLGGLILTVMVIAAGCGETAESAAKAAVKAELDGADVTFGKVDVYGDRQLACGTVNAENAIGGSVGSREFLIWGDRVIVARNDNDAVNIAVCCEDLKQAIARSTGSADSFADFCGRIGLTADS